MWIKTIADGQRLVGWQEPLKKLPFTIPELVAASPSKSADGILYSGKKVGQFSNIVITILYRTVISLPVLWIRILTQEGKNDP